MALRLDDTVTAAFREQLGRKPRVLVVDDDVHNVRPYATLLHRLGYQVLMQTCTHRAANVVLRGTFTPDIIVSDLQNADEAPHYRGCGDSIGGLTLYQRLEEAGKLPMLYIGMSGLQQQDIPPGFLAVCDTVLQKPVDFRSFASQVTTRYQGKLNPAYADGASAEYLSK